MLSSNPLLSACMCPGWPPWGTMLVMNDHVYPKSHQDILMPIASRCQKFDVKINKVGTHHYITMWSTFKCPIISFSSSVWTELSPWIPPKTICHTYRSCQYWHGIMPCIWSKYIWHNRKILGDPPIHCLHHTNWAMLTSCLNYPTSG